MRNVIKRQQAVYRIIDANANRASEGLRVCEEIARFFIESRPLTLACKRIRHALKDLLQRSTQQQVLIRARDAVFDVGTASISSELTRRSFRDVFWANAQRVKESLRVLEEFAKLSSPGNAQAFKRLRYRVYTIEKKALKELSSLRRH